MERGYSSLLTKNTLAYNLAYHLKELDNIEDIHKIVLSILDTFEYKEFSPDNGQWSMYE